jgi:hypothetical protein
MSDIFISYSSKDKGKAELFARTFERESMSVFWDKTIPPGKTFDQYINEQLEAAKCIVVLWSQWSIHSDWVKEEAQRGVQRKILVPVFIDKVAPPLGFGRIETAELFDWEGDTAEGEFQNLLQAIEVLIGRRTEDEGRAESSPQSSVHPPPSARVVTEKNSAAPPARHAPPATSRKRWKSVLGGLGALTVAVLLFFAWQRVGDRGVSLGGGEKGTVSTVGRTSGGWGVVFGSDLSVADARVISARAAAKGIPAARLYLRNGYYANIAVVENRSTAEELLAIAKTFRPDAYIASMDSWCRNPQPRDGFVECR